MAGLYPLSRMQQLDSRGKPLSGARLFLFDGGTSTPRIGYRDSSLTTEHPNPILADASGRLPLIYLDDGFYRHRLTTKTGSLIFDDDGLPVLSSTSGGSGTSVDPDSVFKTRDMKIRFDDQPLDGYARLNGRTIGSAASGATERANADTQSLYEELWPFTNIAVTGGKGANAAADFAANKPLVLPNAAGRAIFGMDDMGAGAQSVLTTAVLGSDPTLPGATGGAQTVTIAQANLPAYTLTGGSGTVSASGTTAAANTDHFHAVAITSGGHSVDHNHASPGMFIGPVAAGAGRDAYLATNVGATGSQSPGSTSGVNTDHTHAVVGNTSGQNTNHNHTVTVTGTASSVSISSGGSGTALNKLPPALTMMIYIRL